MIPYLYEKTYHGGNGAEDRIGPLSSWIECAVTEERNGEFYLEGSLPVGALNVDQLAIDRIIMAAPAPKRPAIDDDPFAPNYAPVQPFRIQRLYKEPDSDMVHVVAPHVSYQLSQMILTPGFAVYDQWFDDVQAIFDKFFNTVSGSDHSATYVTPAIAGRFNFMSDIITPDDVHCPHPEPMSVKAFLGVILEVFGGEFDWDGWRVLLRGEYGNSPRGTVRNIEVKYGQNLETLEYNTDTEELVTSYYGYWLKEPPESAFLYSVVNKAGNADFEYPRIETVDFSGDIEPPEGETVPSQAQVDAATLDYANRQNKDQLPTSITVTAVSDALQGVFLCDRVTVIHPGYGLKQTAKVVRTVYDPIRDRYSSVTIGEIQKGITDTIARIIFGGFKNELQF